MFLRSLFYNFLLLPALVHRSQPHNFENFLGSAFPKVPAGVRATEISVLFQDFELLPYIDSGLKMLPLSRELVIQSVLGGKKKKKNQS